MKNQMDEQEHGKQKDAHKDNGDNPIRPQDQEGDSATGGSENRENGQNLLHGRIR